MQKLVNGQLVNLTPEEITARESEIAANNTAKVLAYIPAYRDKRLYEGITVSGVSVGTDSQTVDRLHKAYDALKEFNPDGVKNWKSENRFVQLNKTQIGALLQAIDAHMQACFDAEAAITGQTFTTTAQVEAAFDAAYSA